MYIQSIVRITNKGVWQNGQEKVVDKSGSSSYFASIYKAMGISYPKFFKMDNLCKLGFLASELTMKSANLEYDTEKRDWSVIIYNHCSSLDDDKVYQQTIQEMDNFYPSPAVFVYTLSNIVTGEIAIRHKIMGESCSYIEEAFRPESLIDASQMTLSNAKGIHHLLIGWVDYLDGEADALMMHVSQEMQKSGIPLTKETVAEAYLQGR